MPSKPDGLQRNIALIELLVRWDFCIGFTLIAIAFVVAGPAVLILCPVGLLLHKTYNFSSYSSVRNFVTDAQKLKPLSKNLSTTLRATFSVPKFTFFLESGRAEPQCISILFFHFVILPENTDEERISDRMKFFISHELSHAKFMDFTSVSWVFIIGLSILLALGDTNLSQLKELYELFVSQGIKNDIHKSIKAFVVILAAVSFANLINVIHRKELHADIGAYQGFGSETIKILQSEKLKESFMQRGIGEKIKDILSHPSSAFRHGFLTGEASYSALNILMSSLLLGLYTPMFALFILVSIVAVSVDVFSYNICILVLSSAGIIYIFNSSLVYYFHGIKYLRLTDAILMNVGLSIGMTVPLAVFFSSFAITIEGALNQKMGNALYPRDLFMLVVLMSPATGLLFFNGFWLLMKMCKRSLCFPLIQFLLSLLAAGVFSFFTILFLSNQQFSWYPLKLLLLSMFCMVAVEAILGLGIKGAKLILRPQSA